MSTPTANVKAYYDSCPEKEWERLANARLEFDINMSFLTRYIKPGDTLLDLGGGPGRYALALAQRGVEVTLCDLSPETPPSRCKKQKKRPFLCKRSRAMRAKSLCSRTRCLIMSCSWGRCTTSGRSRNGRKPCVPRFPA